MLIYKRDGSIENFNRHKIEVAIKKAFNDEKIDDLDQIIINLTDLVISKINKETITVEQVQDLVEQALIEKNFAKQAKAFILYRDHKSKLREVRNQIANDFKEYEVNKFLKEIEKDYPEENYSLINLLNKYNSFTIPNMLESNRIKALIRASSELTSAKAPKWEYIAARFYLLKFYTELKKELANRNIFSFKDKYHYLISKNLYGQYFKGRYSEEELNELETYLDYSKDKLLTYSAVELLYKRYLTRDHNLVVLETPQEMFLAISMHLNINEKENRLTKIKRLYQALSSLKLTMATPTLQNSRKPYCQLSSCFIDTIGDSLNGIFKSINNFAMVSKFGGGMGLYLGKIRASGSEIRGFKGAAGGVIRWVRIINDVAVAVDQLGVRQGACACYLDAWHKDLPEFLQIRTNNGDERMKAHDIFPAICYPDLFWKLCKEDLNNKWYLFDPYEIYKLKGYHLEDCYGKLWEERYLDCIKTKELSRREFIIKDLVRLILKSAVETGSPFCFNRDIVNKYNPNKHQGIIYCSNLCTEIAQNMSEIEFKNTSIETKDGEAIITEQTKAGNFVVCNLASLNLGNIDVTNDKELEEVIDVAVRSLDNVIDLNLYPVPYAEVTNQKYRSIGLGVSGYNHMLANHLIKWESNEHLEFVDKIFEKINYFTIKASNNLSKEKGAYSLFKGSDWDNGDYFKLRNYTSNKWLELAKDVHTYGLRNAYLLAIAPTASTSILAGTSAGIDPIMNKFFLEEKKGEIIPRVAPNLNVKNFFIYKNAHYIDQEWSILAGGKRSRHIDQASSMNLYITTEYTMKQILNLYIHAWENEIKTIYYVRSKSLEIEECESCAN